MTLYNLLLIARSGTCNPQYKKRLVIFRKRKLITILVLAAIDLPSQRKNFSAGRKLQLAHLARSSSRSSWSSWSTWSSLTSTLIFYVKVIYDIEDFQDEEDAPSVATKLEALKL